MPGLDAPEPPRRASGRRGQYPAPRRQQEGPPCWLSMRMRQPRITPLSRWALADRSERSIRDMLTENARSASPIGHQIFPKRDRQNHSFQFWEYLFAAVALPHANVPIILRFFCVQNAVLRIVEKEIPKSEMNVQTVPRKSEDASFRSSTTSGRGAPPARSARRARPCEARLS